MTSLDAAFLDIRGRVGLMCANPRCFFSIHPKAIYGGFCCKKCHWRYMTGSKSKKHGEQCCQKDAAPMAPRAPPVPPVDPMMRNGAPSSGILPEDHVGTQNVLSTLDGCPAAWSSWVSKSVGSSVKICGFLEHYMFNDLDAILESITPDGRYNLRLANGALLKYVKAEHFQEYTPANCQSAQPSESEGTRTSSHGEQMAAEVSTDVVSPSPMPPHHGDEIAAETITFVAPPPPRPLNHGEQVAAETPATVAPPPPRPPNHGEKNVVDASPVIGPPPPRPPHHGEHTVQPSAVPKPPPKPSNHGKQFAADASHVAPPPCRPQLISEHIAGETSVVAPPPRKPQHHWEEPPGTSPVQCESVDPWEDLCAAENSATVPPSPPPGLTRPPPGLSLPSRNPPAWESCPTVPPTAERETTAPDFEAFTAETSNHVAPPPPRPPSSSHQGTQMAPDMAAVAPQPPPGPPPPKHANHMTSEPISWAAPTMPQPTTSTTSRPPPRPPPPRNKRETETVTNVDRALQKQEQTDLGAPNSCSVPCTKLAFSWI